MTAVRRLRRVMTGWRCRREEAIAKSWPYGQELDMKAYTAGKMTTDIKDPKGNRNPRA